MNESIKNERNRSKSDGAAGLAAAAGSFRAAVLSMVKCGESWSPTMQQMADDLATAISDAATPINETPNPKEA
jgi:hypothetical protein